MFVSLPGQREGTRKKKDEGNAKRKGKKGLDDEVHKVTGGGINFEYLVTVETWDCLGKYLSFFQAYR